MFYYEIAAIQSLLHSLHSSFVISTPFAVTSSSWSLEPLKVIHEDQNEIFPNSYEYWYFVSFHES